MKKLGIIAGTGDLPKAVALDARTKGYSVFAIALEPLADKALGSFVDEIEWINIGKFGKIIRALKKYRIKEAVMAGKVSKALLYNSKIIPDLIALKFISSLKDRSDDSILRAVADEIEKEGIKMLNILSFSSSLITPEGVLTKKSPRKDEWQDITFGWKIAKEIGRLDIGQTVVVKNQAVMAIEAIEGTDEAIRRGGRLAGKGAVIVKVSKPNQDMRFDIPVLGLDTLKAMIEVDASVLAAEAGKSIILQKDRLIEESNKVGIILVGYKE
ncbi:MAG: UDP-2,3-diacylglucosamine diphosphatase LpxI [Nitrospirae bacterium]|nr:UDP-2,3-diacylglucosamine diphosphatase LpxI [Nitrospirota bacterium]